MIICFGGFPSYNYFTMASVVTWNVLYLCFFNFITVVRETNRYEWFQRVEGPDQIRYVFSGCLDLTHQKADTIMHMYSNKRGLVVKIPERGRGVNDYLNNRTVHKWNKSSIDFIDCIFINLSGTTYVGNKLLPGSARAYAKLKMKNSKFRYLSGSSSESVSTTLKHLTKIGFGILKEEIYSSLTSTRDYLTINDLRPHLVVTDDALKDFAGLDTSNPNAVVIGYAPEKFNYETLGDCFRKVVMPGMQTKLIAIDLGRLRDTTHRWCFVGDEKEDGKPDPKMSMGKYSETSNSTAPALQQQRCEKYEDDTKVDEDGPDMGAGPFIEGLAYACLEDSVPLVGKPSKEFYWNAMFTLGQEHPISCLVIGDDVENDVIAAIQAGMHGCLVKTGKYRPGDENKLFTSGNPPIRRPIRERCLVVDSVEEAIDRLMMSYNPSDSSTPNSTKEHLKAEVWGRQFEYQTELETANWKHKQKRKRGEKEKRVEKDRQKHKLIVMGFKI